MQWIYLVLAGIMEWGWPVGLKYSWSETGIRFWPSLLAIVSILASGFFLLLAQRTIPMGTAWPNNQRHGQLEC